MTSLSTDFSLGIHPIPGLKKWKNCRKHKPKVFFFIFCLVQKIWKTSPFWNTISFLSILCVFRMDFSFYFILHKCNAKIYRFMFDAQVSHVEKKNLIESNFYRYFVRMVYDVCVCVHCCIESLLFIYFFFLRI